MGLSSWLNPDKETPDYSILVVSDDPVTSAQMQNILEENGYTVRLAQNSLDALEQLNGTDLPHVFIGDFAKPDIDAKAFIDKARIRFGKSALPPMLLLMDGPEDEITANTLELYDLLPKPFEAEALLKCVKHLIDHTVKSQET
jgi:DNA-binding response OmpR family regulator